MRRTGTCVLVLSVLAFAGTASAGNGNDNGNGNGNEGTAPGNSASAPGQLKKEAPPAAAPATTTTTTPAAAASTAVGAAAPSAPANASGVKPANTTSHDTHAEAQSGKTKEYGNGRTAGQIAEKNGAQGTAVVDGPGNSQPHKLASCSGGHEVDVHALKSHRSGSCGGDPTPHPQPDPGPTPGPKPTPGPTPGPTPAPDPGPRAVTPTTKVTTTPSTTTTGEQKPPQAEPGTLPAEGDAAGGTQGGSRSATEQIGHAATLPFTGQPLWLVTLLGVILIATGLALREIRTAEAAVESGHDHTDRSRHAAHGSGASSGGRPGR